MPLFDAGLNIQGDALGDAGAFLAIHTAQPDATGSNPSSAARQPCTWDPSTGGDVTLANPVPFTGGAPGGPAHSVGVWTAVTGGTILGYILITVGDTTFNAAGELTVNSLVWNGQ